MRFTMSRKMANNKSAVRYKNCQILTVSRKKKLTVQFFCINFNRKKLTVSRKMAKNGYCLTL